MRNGIEVLNADGTVSYGKSKAAGRKAVLETAISRFAMPLSGLFGPAAGNALILNLGLMPKSLMG
jgi:hypothetical protein